jgi:hypothetical protein
MSPQLLDTELWAKVASWRSPGIRCGDTWVGCHVAQRRLVGGSRRFVSHAPQEHRSEGHVLKTPVTS